MGLRPVQFYSSMKHCLLSALGGKWNKVRLAMISVFIDDSGTSPNHKVAIAAAVIVESRRIEALDREFTEMLEEEGFSHFHASPCVAGNAKEGFGGWDFEKKQRVFSRVRHIGMKFGVSACSIAIDRTLYDEIMPHSLKVELGKFHYTWAVGYLIKFLDRWASDNGAALPFEYVFDWMGKEKRNQPKREIERVMRRAEKERPGLYEGHYFFRCGKQTPGLQCADLLAWTCYQAACFHARQAPLHPLGRESWSEFDAYSPRGIKWLHAVIQTREQLQAWVAGELGK